ncbi:response regulator [Gloeocapsopsis dulcis]|uniref:Response regulator n=1 Tax=Gloeocapsopsis dulcis AAB1 = 1H9 TaxID=1433147 RepID=A0A6N8G2B1_9CHRO|nr:response regulator [Gloeocapsopsis dulcis]MUL39114.1 response regulator [Gloeocapsopsis dulcis AAB1 = 1H9]WNN90913.1 response regulator [Gloeocapsopsis dulcis]
MQYSCNYRILVVDDLVDNLFLLQTFLEAEGFEVETADSGSQALSQISTKLPDLVLLDVMLPDISGYEVTRQIRQNHNLPFIPILLVTAHDQTNAKLGLDAGANDFIRKPIDFEELLTRISVFLQLKTHGG